MMSSTPDLAIQLDSLLCFHVDRDAELCGKTRGGGLRVYINTEWPPQGCVLTPLLFTLLTHDCTAKYSSNHIIKFADDMTVVDLISKNNESAYREEVQRLMDWCRTNNLSLNVHKTKEMVVDFRRVRGDHPPLNVTGSSEESSGPPSSSVSTSQRTSPGPSTPTP